MSRTYAFAAASGMLLLSMPAKRSGLLGLVLFYWAGAIYVYFLPKDPPFVIVPWNFIRNLFSRGMYIPLESTLAVDLLQAALAIVLIGGVGVLFFHQVRGGGWRKADWIVGFGLGMVLVSVPLELLAIFHLLSRWTVLGSLVIAAGIAALPWQRWLKGGAGGETATESGLESPSYREGNSKQRWERVVWWMGVGLIALISLFTFYHAVCFPVVYWDSLIYYINYAKWTFQQGGFPVKVCAQVGLGLGANYPHLYQLLQVVPAFLFGTWSNVPGQFLPPLLGVLATVLVYRTVRVLGESPLLAIMVALLFRGVPYAVCYFINATDYSLAIFFTALFFYLAIRLFQERSLSWLLFLGLTAAGAARVNYLMPVLVIAFVVIVAWFLWKRAGKQARTQVVVILAVCLVLASTWYVRNVMVTGNPLYPFFHTVLDGRNINEQVLESCRQEWLSNGEGVRRFMLEMEGHFSEQLAKMGPLLRFINRLKWATVDFFLTAEPNYHWKLAPCLVAFTLPGVLIALVSLRGRRRDSENGVRRPFLILTLALFAFLLFYEYFISGIYLYQIIAIVVPMALLAVGPLRAMQASILRGVFPFLVFLIGLVPGLSMALMGPKLMSPSLPGMLLHRRTSVLLRIQSPTPWDIFLEYKFRRDYRIWKFLNQWVPQGGKVLSHENRHLYIRDDIEIIHLDDCGISQLYGEPWEKVRQYLVENGIFYYLFIPNEKNHPILRELGIEPTLETDWEVIGWSGENRLYRLQGVEIPSDSP